MFHARFVMPNVFANLYTEEIIDLRSGVNPLLIQLIPLRTLLHASNDQDYFSRVDR